MAMFSLNIKHAVNFKKVGGIIRDAEKKILQGVAARGMHLARRAIEKAPLGEAASPGQPFRAHPVGKKNITNVIRYGLDASTSSAVIGPIAVTDLYERHEFGGTFRFANKRRRQRRLGGPGLLVIGRGKRKIPMSNGAGRTIMVDATFGKIRTEKQLARVRRLEEEIYGPEAIQANYKPRPVFSTVLEKHGESLMKDLRDAYGIIPD